MKRISMVIITVLATYGLAPAQLVNLIFGPRDGDNAGLIRTYENATVDVELWIRTEPGIHLVGFHLPLSSKDEYISSRNDGYITNDLEGWDVQFLAPNDDPNNDGYTNQSLLGACVDWPDCEFIDTPGQWLKIAVYKMTSGSAPQFDSVLCDAFTEGYHPGDGGIVLADFEQGELDPSQYEVEYACLQFEQFCGDYILGDYNGSGVVNIADLVDVLSWFKTGAPEGVPMCTCPPSDTLRFAVAFDLNNTCSLDIGDICAIIRYWPDYPEQLFHCEYCAPPE